MASEKTLLAALELYGSRDFRQARLDAYPNTRHEWNARAATFEAMDVEGRFDLTIGKRMTDKEQEEFDVIAAAVIKMSER